MKAALHYLKSASYATDDASKLENLLQSLENLNQSFRSSLPSENRLGVRPTGCNFLVSRAKKIKQRALKRLQKAANLTSLVNVNKGRPGRKRQHWTVKNRVGMKVDRLKKVSMRVCAYTQLKF